MRGICIRDPAFLKPELPARTRNVLLKPELPACSDTGRGRGSATMNYRSYDDPGEDVRGYSGARNWDSTLGFLGGV